jgi:hypothetical protein
MDTETLIAQLTEQNRYQIAIVWTHGTSTAGFPTEARALEAEQMTMRSPRYVSHKRTRWGA